MLEGKGMKTDADHRRDKSRWLVLASPNYWASDTDVALLVLSGEWQAHEMTRTVWKVVKRETR